MESMKLWKLLAWIDKKALRIRIIYGNYVNYGNYGNYGNCWPGYIKGIYDKNYLLNII